MMKKINTKKGSALITTVMVVLLVGALIGIVLSLSLYDKTLAKMAQQEVTKQNKLDMMTDLFLKYGTVPSETYGYDVKVYHYENGDSVMTVRNKPEDVLCEMVVTQRDGDLIKREYHVSYEHTESTQDRTIGVHNETDTNPHIKLSIPKSMVSSNAPFYVYGKVKLERAMGIGSSNVHAYVNMGSNGSGDKTVMSFNANTDGWVNLHSTDGTPLKFDKVPSKSLDFIIGLNKTSGDFILSDLVIVNSQNKVCYSLANDSYLNAAGDVRYVNRNTDYHSASNYLWTAHYSNTQVTRYNTRFPIVTRDPDNYVPKQVLQIDQYTYECDGEASVCLYKYPLKQAGGGGGFYYITGRVRVTITGKAEMCDAAGDYPAGQFVDVHARYDRSPDPNVTDYFTATYPAGVTTSETLSFYSNGGWNPLLCQDGSYYKFYIPNDCELLGEDYLKFTLWSARGFFEIADIRVYKLPSQNATPNPATDTCVYNMEWDTDLGNNSFKNCALGDEWIISDRWRIHWFSYSENPNYVGKVDQDNKVGEWKVHAVVNPRTTNHSHTTLYDLPVFSNKIGATYKPQ